MIQRIKSLNIVGKIIILMLVLMTVYSTIDINSKIRDIQEVWYHEYYKSEELENIKLNNTVFSKSINIKLDALKRLEVRNLSGNLKGLTGTVKLNIEDDNSSIIDKVYKLEDCLNGTVLNLEQVELEKDKEYKINLEVITDSEINVKAVKGSQLIIRQVFEFNHANLLKVINLFIIISFITAMIIILRNRNNIANVFLGASILMGILFMFLSPPMNALDEYRHFYRAYDIAQGNYTFKYINKDNIYPGSDNQYHDKYETDAPAAVMPENYHELRRVGNILPTYTDHIFHQEQKVLMGKYLSLYEEKPTVQNHYFSLRATADYNPIAYLPQVIPIKLGIMLNTSPIMVMNLARLGNFCVWIALSYLAIRIVPKFQIPFLIIALSPTNLHLATSNSTDGFLNALAMLFIAYVLSLKKSILGKKESIALIILIGLIGAIKLPYALLIILILTLENISFKNKLALIIGGFGAAMIAYISWVMINSANTNEVFNNFGIEVYSTSTLKYVQYTITHPLEFIGLVLNEIRDKIINSNNYIWNALSRIGWGGPVGSDFIAYGYLICVLIGIRNISNDGFIKNIDRWVSSILVVILYTGIVFVAFTWKPLGTDYIWGVQGRYFIPLIPLCSIFLIPNNDLMQEKVQLEEPKDRYKLLKSSEVIIIAFTIWALTESLQQMLLRYWI